MLPFKDHPQFPILVDILSRKDVHHACLHVTFSSKWHAYFMKAFSHYLANEAIPSSLRGVELVYVNAENLASEQVRIQQATSQTRILFFTQQHSLPHDLEKYFQCVAISAPTELDKLAILKQQSADLEHFHHVMIPEDILSQAYSLAERYLSTADTLEKALLLLDSAAARANGYEERVLTLPALMKVLATWTQIPVSHLQLNKFQLQEFVQAMQQRVFGQDAAITAMAHALQQAEANLQQRSGPFCGLWLVGDEHTGKRTAALALTDQLFKQLNVLHVVELSSPMVSSILEIKSQRFKLKEIIQQMPYAIFL
ncbi:MAG: hypothetical protein EPO11_07710, partial [Gammaproteobacteria bacterium]